MSNRGVRQPPPHVRRYTQPREGFLKTVEYLDAVKGKLGIESDYALSKALNITRSAVSGYRTGRSTLDHLVAGRVATILGIPAVRVIADIEIERATKPEQRQLWKRIKDAAVVAFMAIGGALVLQPAPALAGFNNNFFSSPSSGAGDVRPGRLTLYTLRALVAFLRRLGCAQARMIGGRA